MQTNTVQSHLYEVPRTVKITVRGALAEAGGWARGVRARRGQCQFQKVTDSRDGRGDGHTTGQMYSVPLNCAAKCGENSMFCIRWLSTILNIENEVGSIYQNILYGIHIYVHTVDYQSAIKEWNNAIGGNSDKPRDDLTKWIKSDKERAHAIAHIQNIYVKTNWYRWTCLQTRNRLREHELRAPRGQGRLRIQASHVHTAMFKTDDPQETAVTIEVFLTEKTVSIFFSFTISG